MIYVLEFLFTFFMVFYTSDLGNQSTEIGLLTFCLFLFAHFISSKIYANLSLCLSFFVTSYRPFTEVLFCLLVQVAGAFLGTLLLLATGYNLSVYETEEDFMSVLIIELFAAFCITLVYYIMFLSVAEQQETNGVFAVAAIYAAFAISFPNLPAGNFLKVMAGLNGDINLALGSLIGQLIGSIGGSLLYKFVLCENGNLKMKEIDLSNDDININF